MKRRFLARRPCSKESKKVFDSQHIVIGEGEEDRVRRRQKKARTNDGHQESEQKRERDLHLL